MDYRIETKEAFTVMGVAKKFMYETAKTEIPKFWVEHFKNGGGKKVAGMYGVNIDQDMGMKEFEYLIADDYSEEKGVPAGCVTRTIPKLNWVVFSSKGPMPTSMQDTQNKIFSEWLPNCKDYEIAAGYNIEMYDIPCNYPNGINDENYYCEIWIPVKKK